MNVFRTRDLGFASALYCNGYKLISKDEFRPGYFEFVFEESASFEQDNYFNGTMRVRAVDYFSAIKSLKAFITNN